MTVFANNCPNVCNEVERLLARSPRYGRSWQIRDDHRGEASGRCITHSSHQGMDGRCESQCCRSAEIDVAPTYGSGDTWICTMRHIALEGRCCVVGSGTALRASDIPPGFPARAGLFPDPEAWINDGDSVLVDPMGKVVASPLRRESGILYAEIDTARVVPSRRTLDVTGHYARPDIFKQQVRRAPPRLPGLLPILGPPR